MADENSNIKAFPGAGEARLSRNMPHNLPAEQNLLGAILLDNSVAERIDDRLTADHFYDPLHGQIYATMSRLIERGQLANPVTLKSFFEDQDNGTQDSNVAYLAELADGVISIIQAPDYASIIYEAHIRRQLILIGDQVIQKLAGQMLMCQHINKLKRLRLSYSAWLKPTPPVPVFAILSQSSPVALRRQTWRVKAMATYPGQAPV